MREAVGTSASELEPRQSNRYGRQAGPQLVPSLDVFDLFDKLLAPARGASAAIPLVTVTGGTFGFDIPSPWHCPSRNHLTVPHPH